MRWRIWWTVQPVDSLETESANWKSGTKSFIYKCKKCWRPGSWTFVPVATDRKQFTYCIKWRLRWGWDRLSVMYCAAMYVTLAFNTLLNQIFHAVCLLAFICVQSKMQPWSTSYIVPSSESFWPFGCVCWPIIHSGIPIQEFVSVPAQWETVHVITGIKENTCNIAWTNKTFVTLDCSYNTTKQWSLSWFKYVFKQVYLPLDFLVFIWNMFRHIL